MRRWSHATTNKDVSLLWTISQVLKQDDSCRQWKKDAPKTNNCLFNERPGMKVNVQENADPFFFLN